ncbi:hypothetical protein Tco_0818710 [Tanacetum coccineum]
MYGHNHWQRNKGGTSQNAESQTALIDAAVKKAHTDLLVAGESVTTWRVSQAALIVITEAKGVTAWMETQCGTAGGCPWDYRSLNTARYNSDVTNKGEMCGVDGIAE